MKNEVRNIERKYNLWNGFRDELIATAMTLSLLVLGSFLVTETTLMHGRKQSQKVDQALAMPTNNPQTLGVTDTALPPPTPEPETVKTNTIQSTQSANLVEVPYGEDQDFDYPAYSMSFRFPRISFEEKTNNRRKLLVTVWIKNKEVQAGLKPRLTASIVKDGIVIVPAALMYASESRTLAVGEELSFTASLSLIEATDVRELKFKPGNDIPETSYFLYP